MDYAEALNAGANQVAQMQGIAQANNAWSAGQAQIQREWQEQQNAKAMAFNQNEAAKNRNWQEMLSNTAHQREVRDLMAAGLNPVLSAMNGNGASVGSGATAQGVSSQGAKGDTDTSANGAIANLLGSILAANTQIQAANINARTQEAVAEKYTAMDQIVANIGAAASRYGADTAAGASRYGADKSAAASRYHSDRSAAASMYGSDAAKIASMFGASEAASASRYGADMAYKQLNDFGRGETSSMIGMIANRIPGIIDAFKSRPRTGLFGNHKFGKNGRSGGFGK